MPRTLAHRRGVQLLTGALALSLAGAGAAYAGLSDPGGANRQSGDQSAEVAAQIKYGKAKNVILFIGDGMGDSEITVARNYLVGAAGRLPGIDSLPLTGQYTTYALHKGDDPLTPNTDDTGLPDYVTDSAASGTGWATGTKTYNGAISVGLDGKTANQTLLEWAKTQGKKTGDITTAEVQDATPAVQVSHVADRGCYTPVGTNPDNSATTKDTKNCPGQTSIEEQLLKTKPDVTMGGGRQWFNVKATGSATTVYDNAKAAGFQIPETKADLDKITKANQSTPLLGLFAAGNMPTRYAEKKATAKGYADPATRCAQNTSRPATQPSLADMTTKSLQLLDNDKGFFLQVEGASIDKQDHAANACGQIGETEDLDEAVKVGMDFAKTHGDTLVLLTADHAHTSQIINAADITTDPNTIPLALTTNLLTKDDTVETVAYGTAQSGGSQQHTGTQLRIAGYGPGAANVVGLTDQTDMFNTIKGALGGINRDLAPKPGTTPVPVPTPVPGPVCTNAGAILNGFHAKLVKAKKHDQDEKVMRLKAKIKAVLQLAAGC